MVESIEKKCRQCGARVRGTFAECPFCNATEFDEFAAAAKADPPAQRNLARQPGCWILGGLLVIGLAYCCFVAIYQFCLQFAI